MYPALLLVVAVSTCHTLFHPPPLPSPLLLYAGCTRSWNKRLRRCEQGTCHKRAERLWRDFYILALKIDEIEPGWDTHTSCSSFQLQLCFVATCSCSCASSSRVVQIGSSIDVSVHVVPAPPNAAVSPKKRVCRRQAS